jgi:hypothetical protein
MSAGCGLRWAGAPVSAQFNALAAFAALIALGLLALHIDRLARRARRLPPPVLRWWHLTNERLDASQPTGAFSKREWLQQEIQRAHKAGAQLDLRRCSLENFDLGLEDDEEIDLVWEGLVFGLEHEEQTASVAGIKFSRTTLSECQFTKMELDRVDFTGCTLVDCDFRYASFRRAGLGHATFIRCDMFGASIEPGTIALETKFRLCTTPELGDGIKGLQWDGFEARSWAPPQAGEAASVYEPIIRDAPALAAEDASAYESILRRTAPDRAKDAKTVPQAIDRRLQGASEDYRALSGYWGARGRFRDANAAYVRSRRLERQAASPLFASVRLQLKEGTFAYPAMRRASHRRTFRTRVRERAVRPLKWAGLWVADLISRFGQSMLLVFLTFLLVILLPGFAYDLWGGVTGAKDLGDDLLFSASHVTPSAPNGLTAHGDLAEWLGIAQTVIAVALVGLFGFVLGNVLRQS